MMHVAARFTSWTPINRVVCRSPDNQTSDVSCPPGMLRQCTARRNRSERAAKIFVIVDDRDIDAWSCIHRIRREAYAWRAGRTTTIWAGWPVIEPPPVSGCGHCDV